jgi:hypothetical protein
MVARYIPRRIARLIQEKPQTADKIIPITRPATGTPMPTSVADHDKMRRPKLNRSGFAVA